MIDLEEMDGQAFGDSKGLAETWIVAVRQRTLPSGLIILKIDTIRQIM